MAQIISEVRQGHQNRIVR